MRPFGAAFFVSANVLKYGGLSTSQRTDAAVRCFGRDDVSFDRDEISEDRFAKALVGVAVVMMAMVMMMGMASDGLDWRRRGAAVRGGAVGDLKLQRGVVDVEAVEQG